MKKFPIGKPDVVTQNNLAKSHFQMTYQNLSSNEVAIVTGPNYFRYLKVDDGAVLKDSIDTSSNVHDVQPIHGQGISTNYTCHCWTPDVTLLVCTDLGDIMILNYDG